METHKGMAEPKSRGVAFRVVCLFTLFTTLAASTVPHEKVALISFKGYVTDPMGMLANWVGDPCDNGWAGVDCNGTTSDNLNKYVRHLYLANFQLGAPNIPSSLQDLRDLETLDLGNNYFGGSIPIWIGNLTNLTRLDFQSNQLTGEVPAVLGQLRSINFLRLTNNSLTGTLPLELGNLPNMFFFACEDNLLGGPIPATFGNLTGIGHFHMDHNQFTGPIPEGLGQLPKLLHLMMNDNLLTGPLPTDLGDSASLLQLKLDNNPIGTSLPPNYGNLGTLTDLRIRNCSLTGNIPDTVDGLKALQVMDLGNNTLGGSIPSTLGDLQSIVSLSLDGNGLGGTIPTSFASIHSLEILDLSYNHLTGPIPQDIGLVGNLLSLSLENNDLNGTIPVSLKRSSLEFVVYGNPLCQNPQDSGDLACGSPGATVGGSINHTCICPRGMLFRPFVVEGELPNGCDCVAPLVVELFLPRVLYTRFSDSKQVRLISNMARELLLLPWQVLITSSFPNGTGTDVTFYIVPLAGQSLDNQTIVRIHTKLFAPYYAALWLDGEFGWFDYAVLLFVLPVVSDVYPPFPAVSPPVEDMKGVKPAVWASAVTVGILVLLTVAGGISFLVWKQRQKLTKFWHGEDESTTYAQSLVANGQGGYVSSRSRSPIQNTKLPQLGPPVKIYTLEELSQAVGNFTSENLIGTGGFGAVYQGLLSDGTAVAVKKLSGLSKQGEAEFRTEVQMIAHQLYNPHLVRLLGYCSQGDERLLVYDLMTRGSLLDYLKDGTYTIPLAVLDWKTRIRIALDAAAGLQFLHESDPPVVHRDIKPSNILLDANFNGKVADFGLSKLYPTSKSSHVTTRVVGTFGYLAPDYSITGKLTVKSDVYSYGVVLLEILSGRHSTVADEENMEQYLVPWAKPYLNDRKKLGEIVDPALEGAYPAKGAEMVASLISSCLQLDPDRRPNMGTVRNILSLVNEIPCKTMRAQLQRESLLNKKHSFRVASHVPSSFLQSSAEHSGQRSTQFSGNSQTEKPTAVVEKGGNLYSEPTRACQARDEVSPAWKALSFTTEEHEMSRTEEVRDVVSPVRAAVPSETTVRHQESPGAREAFVPEGVVPR